MKSYRSLYAGMSAILYGTILCLTPLTLIAGGDSPKDLKDMSKNLQPEVASNSERNWSVELSSGVLFSNIRVGSANNNTMVPIQVAGVLKIDDVSLDQFAGGVFRGNTEFVFRGDYYQVTYGHENRLGGVNVGPRYNFVQPGWKLVPYVEGVVGVLFADSNATPYDNQQRGLGQDFNFTFGVAAGARYDITDNWYLRLSAEYMHVSNAGLSEPERQNKAIDAIGPKVSIGYRF